MIRSKTSVGENSEAERKELLISLQKKNMKNMKLWPFKKKKNVSEIEIQDGKIIFRQENKENSQDIQIQTIKHLDRDDQTGDPDISKIETKSAIQESEDMSSFERPLESAEFHPPVKVKYNPSFLCDDSDGGDLGLYLHYLKAQRYKERTRAEYMIDLRAWRQALNGCFPDAEKVQQIANELSPHRGYRLLTALKSYAKYRNLYGDPRLSIMFATSLAIQYPKIPKPKKTRKIKPGAVENVSGFSS